MRWSPGSSADSDVEYISSDDVPPLKPASPNEIDQAYRGPDPGPSTEPESQHEVVNPPLPEVSLVTSLYGPKLSIERYPFWIRRETVTGLARSGESTIARRWGDTSGAATKPGSRRTWLRPSASAGRVLLSAGGSSSRRKWIERQRESILNA